MNKVLISPKESEALKHLALGLTDGEIAHVMKISYNTARSHIDKIKQKTCIRSRALLALFALKYGHITREEMSQALDSALHTQERQA